MKTLSVFFQDVWRALKNPKVLIPLIAVMLIPILYTGVYLTAFWDPYGKLETLPVAVVNQDKGAEFEGEQLHIGEDLVDELKKEQDFNWQFVDMDEAKQGMDNNEYYMMITIPEDFSERATTLMDENPNPSELIYEPNGDYNFIGAQIGNTAMKEISKKVSAAVTESYTETLLDKFTEIADGFKEAGDGATKIDDGAGELNDGALTLQDNLKKLSDGTLELQEGIAPLVDGVQTLDDGAGQLSSGASDLSSGLSQLVDAEGQLAGGAIQLQEGAGQLKDGISSSREGAQKLSDGLSASSEGADSLVSGLEDAADGSKQLVAGLTATEAGANKLSDGLKSAADGSKQLVAGLTSSKDASKQIAEGAQGVADGLKQLTEQSPELAALPAVQKLLAASQAVAEGSSALSEGQDQLLSGAEALNQGNAQLSSGADELLAAQQQLLSGAESLNTGHGQLLTGAQQLADAQKQLAAGASTLADGQDQLLAGADQLYSGQGELASNMNLFGEKLSEAATGSETLSSGAADLKSGTSTLASGVGDLTDGVDTLADGSVKLTDGAGELYDGLTELKDGTGELADELNDAADETAEMKDKDDSFVEMFAEPVQTVEDESRSVSNYGTGLTPYFMSIGLFVGALISTIVMNMRETSVPGATPWARFVSRFFAFAGMSIIQAVAIATFMLYVLHLEVHSVPYFYLFSIITGLASMMIVQALVTWFDLVGRYLAIVLLVLQLATSGGTFPLETLPGWMKPISHFLPMYHSVIGYRGVVMSGNYDVMWHEALILGIFAVSGLVLTLAYFLWSGYRKRNDHSENQDQTHSGEALTV